MPDKWKFTSYERDNETGLDYATNRYYTSRYARFMSVDLLAGDPSVPQSLNRYTYTGNDPINLVDPLGLDCFTLDGKKIPCNKKPGDPEPGKGDGSFVIGGCYEISIDGVNAGNNCSNHGPLWLVAPDTGDDRVGFPEDKRSPACQQLHAAAQAASENLEGKALPAGTPWWRIDKRISSLPAGWQALVKTGLKREGIAAGLGCGIGGALGGIPSGGPGFVPGCGAGLVAELANPEIQGGVAIAHLPRRYLLIVRQ